MPAATNLPDATRIGIIDLLDDRWDDFASLLSENEQARAARFVKQMHRIRFTRCHAAMRYILSQATCQTASMVAFETGPYGKPHLSTGSTFSGQPDAPLHFNLSHSGDIALLALAKCEVGIDIEEIKAERNLDGLEKMVCHPAEYALLEAVEDSPARHALFYRLWTFKEACCKALGTGLRQELSDICVAGLEGDGWRGIVTDAIVATAENTHRQPTWQVTPLDAVSHLVQQRYSQKSQQIASSYAAALCLPAADHRWYCEWVEPHSRF